MAMGHVLRRDGLLHEIIEGKMKGKLARGRKQITDATWSDKSWWLCCTQARSWRKEEMEI